MGKCLGHGMFLSGYKTLLQLVFGLVHEQHLHRHTCMYGACPHTELITRLTWTTTRKQNCIINIDIVTCILNIRQFEWQRSVYCLSTQCWAVRKEIEKPKIPSFSMFCTMCSVPKIKNKQTSLFYKFPPLKQQPKSTPKFKNNKNDLTNCSNDPRNSLSISNLDQSSCAVVKIRLFNGTGIVTRGLVPVSCMQWRIASYMY